MILVQPPKLGSQVAKRKLSLSASNANIWTEVRVTLTNTSGKKRKKERKIKKGNEAANAVTFQGDNVEGKVKGMLPCCLVYSQATGSEMT